MSILDGVHQEWVDALDSVLGEIETIEGRLKGLSYNPAPANILRCLHKPISEVSVVIFGQDPYPAPAHAMGLAFSVPSNVSPIPKTLTNIFQELNDDIGCPIPDSGDLTRWTEEGVALINRILTVPSGQSGGHSNLGWQHVTDEIARILGDQGVVPILWGKYAQELESFFAPETIVSSVHPSPLSAYRGFFGSKPFSKTNQLLAAKSERAIDWSLS
jgi:uracil-DNA glycosylase